MKHTYLAGILLTTAFLGCTNKFEDFNTDKKNPAVVSASALFTSGMKYIADQVNTSDVNANIFKLFSQYWTQTTYTNESNYEVVDRNIAQHIFENYYRKGFRNLQEAKKYIESEEGDPAKVKNKQAIIELLYIYSFQQLVDMFGAVPYTDALNINNVYPKYNDGLSIYKDLFKRLDAALSNLTPGADSFGEADLFYKGNVASWIKFGYSLKVKLGISMADVASEEVMARGAVEAAYTKAFSSSEDDCKMPYLESSPSYNPLYEEIVASGRQDYVIANTLIDVLNNRNDPRRKKYCTEAKGGGYKGGKYGHSSSYVQLSKINEKILDPKFPGPMMTYTEILFYLAEAAARGYAVGKTAEEYYNLGIRNSILEWGGTQAEADAYLAQPTVAFATAVDRSKDGWREKIGIQSWIANYTKGLEAWTTWRRLDYPIFNVPENKSSVKDIPTRFTFPVNEQTLNENNYKAAAAAIGGDELTTKIFWDIYNVTKP